MKLNTVKKVDRHIGVIICTILNLHKRLVSSFNRPSGSAPEKIAFIKLFGMGSVTLAQPLIAEIKGKFPDAKIYFVTFSNNKGILELFGLTNKIIYIEFKTFSRFITSAWSALTALRKERIDIIFNLEFFSRFTSIFTYLTGAKCRAEFYSEVLWRGDLYTHGIKLNPYFHIRDNFINLASHLGIVPQTNYTIRPVITDNEKNAARSILADNGISAKDKIICVNVNAGDLAVERRWPAEYFTTLISRLASHPVKIVLIGGPSDYDHVASIARNITGNIINVAGKTTLAQLTEIIKESSLFITNDSGPLHLAATTDTPIVSLFGPETPMLYGYDNNNYLTFYKGLMCSPCLNVLNAKTVCCDYNTRCMRDISPDEVYLSILKKYPKIFAA